MGRTTLVWTPVANTTTWKPHGVCDGPTFAALQAAKIASSEGAKPLPIMCNRSESGGFFWEIGQYGDYRPLGTGDRGSSKAIEALAAERAAKLQRRREYDRERYAAMPPEQKEALLKQKREYKAAMPPEEKEALLKQKREWYAAMPPEQKEALLKQMREYKAAMPVERQRQWYATMPPEQKEAYLKKQRECNPSKMEAGTLARASAVPVLPGHYLAGDRLCIFGCGRPANAERCRACKNCCLLHPEEWEGCNRTKNGVCKVKSHR